jgi:hypothetical protein
MILIMTVLAAAIKLALESGLIAEEVYAILRERYSDEELYAACMEVAGGDWHN